MERIKPLYGKLETRKDRENSFIVLTFHNKIWRVDKITKNSLGVTTVWFPVFLVSADGSAEHIATISLVNFGYMIETLRPTILTGTGCITLFSALEVIIENYLLTNG